MQSFNKTPIIIVLLTGGFISILNQTTMITAIPPIMDEMDVSANTGQWLTTVFMLVNGVMIPVTAFLMARFTARQLFITAMTVFAVGTAFSAMAPNFGMLLLGRIIQSSGAGVIMPLMQTVFLLLFPVRNRGVAMGLVGLVISFAPAIGPALSGWIITNYSWRAVFLLILPIAIIVIVFAAKVMKNVTELTYPKLDMLSIILSSFGFGGFLYGFTSAGNNGWASPITITTLIVGTVALVCFIIRQLRMETPMLEFRVFKNPIFTLSTIIPMIAFMGLIGTETLVPLYMQNARGFTAMEAGIALLPGALVNGMMSPITGKIFDRFGARWLAVTGLIIITISTFAFTNLGPSTSMLMITILYAIRMFGLSMVMMPVTTAGLNQLPRDLIPHGTAMTNTMRQVSASVGTAIVITIMTTTEMSAEHNPDISYPMIHGVNTAFMVITILSLIGVVISFFMKNGNTPAEEQSHMQRDEREERTVRESR
ncbi:putative multidrug resistance protein EmrY [Oceanobacillus oncorhynchi]|uniref:Putative multidrug resistance protein EmrY n=1 Tax=Oceanobacillus oncorhynchi TaxID=545501 RepID=A0A0A1MCY7_9BACI|nr:MDR family MFS transporter [Oceanobacillus oncorhynchi]CEI83225.1 putative multidrug resistance protein EmrY [Oceanobacillus oncorhynchi]